MKKADILKQAQGSAAAGDRFSRAAAVLEQRPTGFHAVSRDRPPSDVPSQATSSDDKKIGRFERVSETLIDPNPFNARKIYRPQRIGELAESIGAIGQIQPGVATIRNGRYVLAAGHYRLAGIRQAHVPDMDLMVHDGMTDRDLFEYSYRENDERDSQSALDDAMAWREILKQGLYPNETALAAVVKKSLSTVNRTLSILKLSPPVLDLVSQNPEAFAMSCLAELVQLETVAGTAVTLTFAERVGQGEIGRNEINEARARFEAPKSRKPKEISRQYKLRLPDGAHVGVLKEWDSGRVTLDAVFASPADRHAIMDDLKKRFSLGDS